MIHTFVSVALLAAAAVALPASSPSDSPKLDARAGGFGFVDPDSFFCNQTWVTPSASTPPGSSAFRPADGIIERESMGGFSGTNLTQVRETCIQQCTYAQYPASPALTGPKCQTAFVADKAPSTYTNYANNSNPETQAPTHIVCHWLSYRLEPKDLVIVKNGTWTNATAEVISCPGVVYDPKYNTP